MWGSNWADIATVAIAFLALIVSASSFAVSFWAARLAKKQEDRKRPELVASLVNSYVEFKPDERIFAFLLSICNPSDSDNSVAAVALRVTYDVKPGHPVTVQLPSSTTRGDRFSRLKDFNLLGSPSRVDAHQTVQGWCMFRLPETVLSGGSIEGYSVVVTDSHGMEVGVKPILIQEYADGTIPA